MFGGKEKQGFLQAFVFIGVAIILAWYALDGIERIVKRDIRSTLDTILKTTHEAIQFWAHDRRGQVTRLATSNDIRALTTQQVLAYQKGESLANTQALSRLRVIMNAQLKEHNDLGFFLVASDYTSIGSMRDSNLGTENLLAGKGDFLERIFKGESVVALPIRSDVPLPGLDGKLIPGEPTMFIGAPVRGPDGEIIAALTLRVNPSLHFTRIASIARMGQTGETYAFNKAGKLITESRFEEELRRIGLIKTNERGILSVDIRDPGTNLVKGERPKLERTQQPFTLMAKSALRQEAGSNVDGYRDYRGVFVFGAWLWSEELGLGLASEIDAAEAMTGYHSTRNIVIFVIGFTLALALFFNARLGKHLVESEALRREAETATKAKSEFLTNMSHELRTPLNGILGMADIALKSDLTEEQQKQIKLVKYSGETLLVLINDILDLSKIETGKLELVENEFNLHELIDDTAEQQAVFAQGKGLEFIISVGDDVPVFTLGDPTRLRQVLVNLTGNAIKFTHEGEVTLDVSLESAMDDTMVVLFKIKDTGIGVSEERQQAIFERFSQEDASTSRKYGGAGLGTTISKQLVELMGGRMWLKSQRGKGSEFYFTVVLPRLESSHSAVLQAPESVHGLRVLVVDDNATNRLVLTRVVASWRMEVKAVESGVEVLESLSAARQSGHPFDVLLLDYQMPEQNGLEVAELVRETFSSSALKIILLSSGWEETKETWEKAGVDRRLAKPVKRSELLNTMLTLTSKKAAYKVDSGKKRSGGPSRPARKLSILVAEDNPVNREVVVSALSGFGHKTTVAKTGREAVTKWEKGAFDLILMDVQMPEMDGFMATQAIRDREKNRGGHIPIIALTAHAMPGDKEKCLEAGMDDHVAKPININQLEEMIAAYSGGASAGPPAEPEIGDPPREADSRQELSAETLYDLSEVRAMLRNDPSKLGVFMNIFLESMDKNIAGLEEAVEVGDPEDMGRFAHVIKGSVAQIKAHGLVKLTIELEEMAKKGKLAGAQEVFITLNQAYEKMKSRIMADT